MKIFQAFFFFRLFDVTGVPYIFFPCCRVFQFRYRSVLCSDLFRSRFFRLRLGVTAQMTFMKLDLSSLESVRAFVVEFKASKLGLDSLVLNAGVMHNVRVLLQTSERYEGIAKHTNDGGSHYFPRI